MSIVSIYCDISLSSLSPRVVLAQEAPNVLKRTSRTLDCGRLAAANLSSFCRDAIRLIVAEVHAEVADGDSDAEGRKKHAHTGKKKRNKLQPTIGEKNIYIYLFVLQGTSFHAALFLCVSCVSCGDSHENLPPAATSSLCLQVERAALVQKDTMRWQLCLAAQAEPEQEERLPPRGRLSQLGRCIYLPAHAGSPVVSASFFPFFFSSKIQPTGCGQTLSSCWIMDFFFLGYWTGNTVMC